MNHRDKGMHITVFAHLCAASELQDRVLHGRSMPGFCTPRGCVDPLCKDIPMLSLLLH